MIHTTIDDWAPINDKKDLTEIALVVLNEGANRLLRGTLEQHGIEVSIGTDNLLILSKPSTFMYHPQKEELILLYNEGI